MGHFFGRTKTIFFFLCITSGFLSAVYLIIDTWTLSNLPVSSVAYGLISMWIGGVIFSFLTIFLFKIIKIPVGTKKRSLGWLIDPEFKCIHFPRRTNLKAYFYIAIAGTFGGFNALFYFFAASLVDPSIMQPLLQFLTLYLLVVEVIIIEKELPATIELLAVMNVALGGVLLTVSGEVSGDVLIGAIFVLGPINISQLFITYFQKKARMYRFGPNECQMDALNIRTWYVMFMTVSMTIFSIPFIDSSIIQEVLSPSMDIVFISTMSMLFAFISYVMYIRSLSMGKMSTVNAVTSISIVFSVALTAIFSFIDPKSFGSLSADPFFWLLKIIGTIMVVCGIIALSISDVKTYIFINCKIGYIQHVWQELKNLNFQSVSLVAGTYDIIVFLNIRTIGRVNSLLIKKIERIEGIEHTYSIVVFKKWDLY